MSQSRGWNKHMTAKFSRPYGFTLTNLKKRHFEFFVGLTHEGERCGIYYGVEFNCDAHQALG